MDFMDNFTSVPLAQQFFEAIFKFITAAVMHRILSSPKLQPDDAVAFKMTLLSLQNWLDDAGGVWTEKYSQPLEPISQAVQVMFVRKRSLLESRSTRREIAPLLTETQIKTMLTARKEEEDAYDVIDDALLEEKMPASAASPPEDQRTRPQLCIHLDMRNLHYVDPSDLDGVAFPTPFKDGLIAFHVWLTSIGAKDDTAKYHAMKAEQQQQQEQRQQQPLAPKAGGGTRTRRRLVTYLSSIGTRTVPSATTDPPTTTTTTSSTSGTDANNRRLRKTGSFAMRLFQIPSNESQ